jgi:starch phosphorylase
MEGYDGTNGFAIGNGNDVADVATTDALDAESLYRTLELEVVPLYYQRDEAGVPRQWIGMMKRAIQTLAPQYNSDRMVEEYARKIYP